MTGVDTSRARELLCLIDVDALGLDRVLASLLHSCEEADRDLLMEAIQLSYESDLEGWPDWVDCLLREGPRSERLLETGPLMPEELPEPEDLKDIALDQARILKEAAYDFLLSDNHPHRARSAAYELDLAARELEEWAGLPARPSIVEFEPPDWLEEYTWDENGVLQGWIIDEETGNAVPDGTRKADAPPNPIDAMVEEMNETHCLALEGGKLSVFVRDHDTVLGRTGWLRVSVPDFKGYHLNDRIPVPDVARSKFPTRAELWLNSPRQRKHPGIVMDPQNLPENRDKLNLWEGWAVEPSAGEWPRTRDLIGEVLCDGSTDAFDYVLRWTAYMLQSPWEPAQTAICFRGEEGTGKGTFGRALMRIAGKHALTVSSPAQFAGRFNAHLRDCVFLFADEAFWPGNKEAEGVLKQLVTEPVISYEAKGKDILPGRNMIHIMVASNNEWIVPAGPSARRFFVQDVPERRMNDFAYFERVNDELGNGGLEAMAHELMGMDLTGWSPYRNLPKTEALGRQKLLSAAPLVRWWHSVLDEGTLPAPLDGEVPEWDEGPVDLDSDFKAAMAQEFDVWLKQNRIHYLKSSKRGIIDGLRPIGLSLSVRDRGKSRVWTVPPLAEARERFEAFLGASELFDDAEVQGDGA